MSAFSAHFFFGNGGGCAGGGRNSDAGFNDSGKSVFNTESSPASGSFADIRAIGEGRFPVAGRARISAGYYAVTLSRFNGDGLADIALWRESTGEWFTLRSEDGSFFSLPFGRSDDISAPADYDNDDKTDAAVFRPASATWFVLNSNGGAPIVQFGAAEDKPVAADFDGDGRFDTAVFRPSNAVWHLQQSPSGFTAVQFGAGGCCSPIPDAN